MKWVAISGSGRGITPGIEKEVRAEIRHIFERGGGIVTGGVLGVDYISTDEALSLDSTATRIKVCLPASLEVYLKHFKTRADITEEEGTLLEKQLKQLHTVNQTAIVELMQTTEVNKAAYEARNDLVLSLSDALLAFSVNKSKGTQYTVEKARSLSMPVELHEYTVPA